MTNDIDDKLLEQQEQELKEQSPQFKVSNNGHDREEESKTPVAEEELKQYQEQEQPGRREQSGEDEPGNGNGKNQFAAEVLVELTSGNAKLLFKDQYGIAHAEVRIGEHNEIIKVESSKFKRYLARLFYDKVKKKVVNAESIANATQVLQAKAEYDGPTISLSLRAAWHGGNIFYDLSNDKWQCVKISREGWEIANSTSPVFVRYNQTPQPDPDRIYEQDIFDRFVQLTNLKEDQDRILLKVYIVSLFIPEIPHAMLILHGEKGSAKSTLQTLIKLLADPGKPALLTIHNDRTEFIQLIRTQLYSIL